MQDSIDEAILGCFSRAVQNVLFVRSYFGIHHKGRTSDGEIYKVLLFLDNAVKDKLLNIFERGIPRATADFFRKR